ncbi:hypothetical protein AX15_004966 [Amanita polypyramis BW_CC]|nr:hypothetical protein AX15_004966 [Amanita polypyramis BW_CC]
MSRSKATTNAAPKPTRPQVTHPSWIEMIKACITAHPDHARQGVSRPQIKKFVEQTYKLEMTTAQNVMLSKALGSGSEKGVFVLPKGPSGRVKFAPKTKTDTSAKENKPTKPRAATIKAATTKAPAKPTPKASTKAGKLVAKTTKATMRKQTGKAAATKSSAGAIGTTTARKGTVGRPKSTTGTKKVTATTKKIQAAKAKLSTATRRSGTTTQRGTAKRSAIGVTATSKAKAGRAAAKKGPSKSSSSRTTAKTSAKGTPRKKSTRRS